MIVMTPVIFFLLKIRYSENKPISSYTYKYTGWPKSHFTLLKANKSKPIKPKKSAIYPYQKPTAEKKPPLKWYKL